MAAPPKNILRREGGKIILFVIDGAGGLPHPERGVTELEAARLPNLDALAARSSVGRLAILPPGLTPGSGPGHLALFGYDPLAVNLGRGVLEALGSDYPLADSEVAARGNFCTLNAAGVITDRRAGRPTDARCRTLCDLLSHKVRLEGAEFRLLPGKEHRFTFVLRGEGLGARLSDNDPQVELKAPLEIRALDAESKKTAAAVASFLAQARAALAKEQQTNGLLLRGFSSRPHIEEFRERYGLAAAAIAIYPMYRGVARLCGMEVIEAGKDLEDQLGIARARMRDFDFIFIHTKDADQAGHGGDFDAKVRVLEEIDRHVPDHLALGARVVAVTGDHSTPAVHEEHSWHPVPAIVSSPRTIPVAGTTFSERGVLGGDLGTIPAHHLMALLLAHADRLDKFGA